MPLPHEPEHYAALLPYCRTDAQRQKIETLVKHPRHESAAQVLGLNVRVLRASLSSIRKHAARKGWDPGAGFVHPVSATEQLQGHSTLYRFPENDPEGRVIRWVKGRPEAESLVDALQNFADGLNAEIQPSPRVPLRQRGLPADLANLFIITDYHLGMLSWPAETGQDWNLEIAAARFKAFFARAVSQAPPASSAVLAQLGDFLHFDGLEAMTPTSGHVLDADSRFHKVVQVAAHLMRWAIELLRDKYDTVHVIVAEGNHDLASSAWLQRMLAELFRDEPRVTVDVNPDPYYGFEHGQTLLLFHHGHKRPPANIDTVLVAKFQREFGRASYVYAHMGHIHSQKVLETNLMVVAQHRTLASRDAYASRGGWMSKQSADVITYHRKFGEVSRFTLTPELLDLDVAA